MSTIFDREPAVLGKLLKNNLEIYLATAIMIFYVSLITVNTTLRLLDLPSTPLGQEVIIGAFVWAVWLSAAYGIKTGEHLRFTSIAAKLSDKKLYLVLLLEWIAWITLAVIVFYYSSQTLQFYIDTGSTITGTSIPVYLIRASVPVGMLLVIFRTLEQAYETTVRFRHGEPISEFISPEN